MTKISKILLTKLKLGDIPAYRVAQMAGVNPTDLSKLLHGALPLHPKDHRIVAVGRILGLTEAECFDQEDPANG